MRKLVVLSLLIIGCIYIPGCVFAEKPKKVEYKTAQECFNAAMLISYGNASYSEYLLKWREKFNLFKRAIELEPVFTEAYVPYIKTYCEGPRQGEYDNSVELDELIKLLKSGLKFKPANGDEFYLQLNYLEFKRWGGTKESLRRSIDYLNRALLKYPDSPIKKTILLSMYSKYKHLGETATGIPYLNKIVELNGYEQADIRALEILIHFYHSENDYHNLLNFCELFIGKFGFNEDYSCYAIYCLSLSSNKLGLHDKVIENSRRYIRMCNRGDSTIKKIYLFLSEAYGAKENYELSKKFRKMSE
ncbi:hypothetical protein K8T06_12070 [bacterium]|nr:hypothetical protein [bacterium]